MKYRRTDPMTEQEARERATEIKQNACPYRGVYDITVARTHEGYIVTWYEGSLD